MSELREMLLKVSEIEAERKILCFEDEFEQKKKLFIDGAMFAFDRMTSDESMRVILLEAKIRGLQEAMRPILQEWSSLKKSVGSL